MAHSESKRTQHHPTSNNVVWNGFAGNTNGTLTPDAAINRRLLDQAERAINSYPRATSARTRERQPNMPKGQLFYSDDDSIASDLSEMQARNNWRSQMAGTALSRPPAISGQVNNNLQKADTSSVTDDQDVNQLVSRLLQVREYMRQAGNLRKSVGGEQGRKLDRLIQQLGSQEDQYISLLSEILPEGRDLSQIAIADRNNESMEQADDDDDDNDEEEEDLQDAEEENEEEDDSENEEEERPILPDGLRRPIIEDTLGRHIDTDTELSDGLHEEMQLMHSEQERMRELLSERKAMQEEAEETLKTRREELEALRNQRDLLRQMLQQQEQLRAMQGHQVAVLQAEREAQQNELLKRRLEVSSKLQDSANNPDLQSDTSSLIDQVLRQQPTGHQHQAEELQRMKQLWENRRNFNENSSVTSSNNEQRVATSNSTAASVTSSSTPLPISRKIDDLLQRLSQQQFSATSSVASSSAQNPEERLFNKLKDLESKKARLDGVLTELSALKVNMDQSTTSTEIQAFQSSANAQQTAIEANDLLEVLDARSQLEKLRSVRDRLSNVRNLVDYYQQAADFIHNKEDEEEDQENNSALMVKGLALPTIERAQQRLLNYGSSIDETSQSATDSVSVVSSSQWVDADPATQARAAQLKDAKAKLSRLQDLLEGVTSLSISEDIPATGNGMLEMAKMEQSQEMHQLLEEREKLVSLQSQLEELHRKLQVPNTMYPEKQSNNQLPVPPLVREIPLEPREPNRKDPRELSLTKQEQSTSVTFQEPVATFVTNEEIYDEMRKERLLREELRAKKRFVGSFLNKEKSGLLRRNQQTGDNQSDTQPPSTQDFTTGGTWGGSNSAASNIDDNAEAEEEEEETAANQVRGHGQSTFPSGLEARARVSRPQSQAAWTSPDLTAETLQSSQILLCLQQCCALISHQQQDMQRLNQQVLSMAHQQHQQPMYPYPQFMPMMGPNPYMPYITVRPHTTSSASQTDSVPKLDLSELKPNSARSQDSAIGSRELTRQSLSLSAGIAGTGLAHESLPSTAQTSPQNERDLDLMVDVRNEATGHTSTHFESLRENIYSEVAALISQNELRPHYLIELFRELQLLSNDYLRQKALFAVQDLVNKYLSQQARGVPPPQEDRPLWLKDTLKMYNMDAYDVEQTPSESYVTTEASEADGQDAVRKAAAQALTRRLAKGQADYSELVYASSTISTPSQSPFAQSLGDTVIHLDRAMQILKEHQDMQEERRRGSGSQTKPNEETVERWGDRSAETRINTRKLDEQIKTVIHHLIPLIKTHTHETATPQFLTWLRDLTLKRVRQFMDSSESATNSPQRSVNSRTSQVSDEFDKFFTRQLSNLISDSLAKFQSQKLSVCLEDLLVDLSEVLFNELAFFKLINNLDDGTKYMSVSEADTDTETVNSRKKMYLNVQGSVDPEVRSESSAQPVEDYADDFEEAASSETDEAEQTVRLAQSETKPMTLIGSDEDEEGSLAENDDQEEVTAMSTVIDAEEKDAQEGGEKHASSDEFQTVEAEGLRVEILDSLSQGSSNLVGDANGDHFSAGGSVNGFVTLEREDEDEEMEDKVEEEEESEA